MLCAVLEAKRIEIHHSVPMSSTELAKLCADHKDLRQAFLHHTYTTSQLKVSQMALIFLHLICDHRANIL